MDDKSLEEQVQLNFAEDECEFEEIDIVSEPAEGETSKIHQPGLDSHSTGKRSANVESLPAKTSTNDKKARLSNTAAECRPFGERRNVVKDETKLTSTNFLQKVQFTGEDEGIPDETDAYKRFYFESDHLALKDNAE